MLLISRTLLNKYDFMPSSIINFHLASVIFQVARTMGYLHQAQTKPSHQAHVYFLKTLQMINNIWKVKRCRIQCQIN